MGRELFHLREAEVHHIPRKDTMSKRTSGTNQLYEVKGTVRLADGSPVAGIKVSAFDRDLRGEQLLGQSQTNRRSRLGSRSLNRALGGNNRGEKKVSGTNLDVREGRDATAFRDA